MFRRVSVVAVLAAALSSAICSAAPAQSFPPQAQRLIDQGVAAARQQDYAPALARFQDAAGLVGYQPALLLNLGLASSKIPGHELRAIAWFEAYLDAAPDAPNAPTVRRQADAIEAAYEAKLRTILDRLESLWRQLKAMPADTLPSTKLHPLERPDDRQKWFVWDALRLAKSRFLLDDAGRAEAILRENFGERWRATLHKSAEDDDRRRTVSYQGTFDYLRSPSQYNGFYVGLEQELAASMIAHGLFDDAMRLVPRLHSPDSVAFALEGGNSVHARALVESGSHYTWLASACFAAERGDTALVIDAMTRAVASPNPKDPAELVGSLVFFAERVGDLATADRLRERAESLAASIGDATQQQTARAFLSGARTWPYCFAYRWSTDMRRRYLITVALSGRKLDYYDDTKLVEVFGSPLVADVFYGSVLVGISSLIDATSDLADAYRKVRGPRRR